jgi:hypothetical protein
LLPANWENGKMRIIFVTGLTALALAVYTLAAESSITTSGSD